MPGADVRLGVGEMLEIAYLLNIDRRGRQAKGDLLIARRRGELDIVIK